MDLSITCKFWEWNNSLESSSPDLRDCPVLIFFLPTVRQYLFAWIGSLSSSVFKYWKHMVESIMPCGLVIGRKE